MDCYIVLCVGDGFKSSQTFSESAAKIAEQDGISRRCSKRKPMRSRLLGKGVMAGQ